MRYGYKWVRASNPAEDLQDAKLREVGLDPASPDVFCDQPPKKRLPAGSDPLPGLTAAIANLRKGDELCIPYPQCFGRTRAEAEERLAGIARLNASLYVVSTGKRLNLVPEMGHLLDFLREHDAPFGPQQTQAARDAWVAHQREKQQQRIKEVLRAWNDPTKTILDVAKQHSISRFTLNKWQKAGLLPPKPRSVR